MDSGVEGSSQTPREPQLWLRNLQSRPGIVFPSGTGPVHLRELTSTPGVAPSDVVQAGDEVTVVVTAIDRQRRRFSLSRRQRSPDHQ
ncbi:S1 RNA-binding domain-containing protein [Streptomyces sp. NPDC050743]|uniref:S1 RNA-binding domain-containing protein n=1 Tax=Streptomyces sp. NPDC050743 TaxID=3365634 RepID=UPI0037A56D7A